MFSVQITGKRSGRINCCVIKVTVSETKREIALPFGIMLLELSGSLIVLSSISELWNEVVEVRFLVMSPNL